MINTHKSLPNNLELNDLAVIQHRIEYVGHEKFPVLVADNVIRNAHAIRTRALDIAKSAGTIDAYPGKVALVDGYRKTFDPLLKSLFRQYNVNFNSAGTERAKRMAVSVVGSKGRDGNPIEIPHVDSNLFQIVLFLNRPNQCCGGTRFFRHRTLGIVDHYSDFSVFRQIVGSNSVSSSLTETIRAKSSMNRYRQLVKGDSEIQSIDLYRLFLNAFIKNDAEISRQWDPIHTIAMQFNRLICFPGFLVHGVWCKENWFGNSIEDKRITLNARIRWPMQ